jgi:hypothetical protein
LQFTEEANIGAVRFSGVPTARGAFSLSYPPVNWRAIFGRSL